MKAILLGSGDPLGMPVALCNCEYCSKGPERLRPGLLVETEETAIVFDVNPDIRQQLIETGVKRVDGFFATHCHVDHFGGLPELHQLHNFANEEVNLYGSKAVEEYIEGVFPWVNLVFHRLENESVEIGDLTVRSFKVEHAENMPMQGFAVEKDGKKIVYIPDLKKIPDSEVYENPDLLFVDGMYFFGKHFQEDDDHASGDELKKQIEKIGAEKTVLINLSEHFNEMSQEEEQEKTEYQIGSDFQVEKI